MISLEMSKNIEITEAKSIFKTSDGSPYHHSRTFFNDQIMSDDENVNKSTQTIYSFDTPNGSPYSRRYPSKCKERPDERSNNDQSTTSKELVSEIKSSYQQILWNTHHGNNDDEDDAVQKYNLPVEIHRCQSMSSVRHQRDPHYQGIRSRKPKRVINKSGDQNVGFSHIPHKSWRFFKDFVNTVIDEQWRYVITLFFLSFFLCWILFAALWYLIAYAHGDLNFDSKTGERLGDSNQPCIENAFNFVGFLLFSIETQVSIGYGSKYPNEECPEAIFLMVVQIVCGVAIEGAMVGIVYAKMIRPPKRAHNMQFSKKAIICQRDSKLCLVFRVCDSKQNQAINSRVNAYWFEERRSPEGESLKNFQYQLELENEGKVFLIFPLTICHIIDSSSPLYDLSAKDLFEKRFEIVITLTGLSNLTGQMIQARTSYLPREIMWGYRFVNMIHYDKSNEAYATNFDQFDDLIPIDTPLCSAKRLEEVHKEIIEEINNEKRAQSADHIHENLDKINFTVDENHDYYILSPQVEDHAVSIRFQNEYKRGEGSLGCLETRFSSEVCAETLKSKLLDHRRSLDHQIKEDDHSTEV